MDRCDVHEITDSRLVPGHCKGKIDGIKFETSPREIRCSAPFSSNISRDHTAHPFTLITMTSLLRSLFPASRIRLPATARYLATTAETSTAADPTPVAESSTSPSEPAKFTPYTRRAGLLARKRGMTALWDQDGRRWPVTVLQVQECQVIQHRTPHESSPHLHGLQIGAKNKHWSKETVFMQGHYRTKGEGVQPKYRLKEFQVTEDAVMKVGSWLSAGHFVPGQYVDVRAKT